MTTPLQPVTCVFTDEGGNPVVGATVIFRINQTDVYDGFVVPSDYSGTTDSTGTAVVNLFPNVLGSTGSVYKVRAYSATGQRLLDSTCVVQNNPCTLASITNVAPAASTSIAQIAQAAALASSTAAAASATSASGSATTATTQATNAAASATAASNAAASASAAAAAASATALSTGSVTVGSTSVPLNGSVSSLAGLTSVAATTFTGALSGNASTATNVAYSGLTGTVPTWNQNTTGNAATASSVAWTGVTGTPTTLAGYGITNAVPLNGALGTPTSGSLANCTGYTYANLSGTVPTWNQNTTGTASLATSLAGGSTNSLPYQSAVGVTAMLATGTGVLTASGGAPAWNASPALTGTNFSGTAASLSIGGNAATATTATTANALNQGNNYTIANTLNFYNGGTGTGKIISNDSVHGLLYIPSIDGSSYSHTFANAAYSLTLLSITPAGNVTAAGSVTGTNFIGAGTGLTGTAASLTAGTANALNLVGTTSPLKLAGSAGLSGQVLTSSGPGATPVWSSSAGSNVGAEALAIINFMS